MLHFSEKFFLCTKTGPHVNDMGAGHIFHSNSCRRRSRALRSIRLTWT